MTRINGRAVGGGKVRGVENVLDADGKSAQRRARERQFGVATRALEVERREGSGFRLARRDRRRAQLDHRAWLQLAGLDPAREIER